MDQNQPEAHPDPTPTGASLSVLVVEDDDCVREVLAGYLETLGFRPLQAPDGRAALELWHDAHRQIDVILISFSPHCADHRNLVHQVRRESPAAPLLVLSAGLEETGQAQLLGLRVAALLQKPIELSDLEEALSQVLAGASGGAQVEPPPPVA